MSLFYNICIPLSGVIMFLFAIQAFYIHSHPCAGKRVFTGLHVFTFGTFIACVIIHLPFYFSAFNFNDAYTYVRPVLLSIHSSLQAFVLGFNYADIINVMKDNLDPLNPHLNAFYTFWIAALYIIAPILTLTNILSLFKSLWNEWRIKITRFRPIYVFSELNEKSIAMAQSIWDLWTEKNKGKRFKFHRPMIVFTDVYTNNEEIDQELLQMALDLRAKSIKKDITRIHIKKRKCPVSFFLIGDNESENIEQAIKLNEENKAFVNRSVYIYSSSPEAGYIFDSIDNGKNSISEITRKQITDDPEAFLRDAGEAKDCYDLENCYYIRRIDSVNELAISTLKSDVLLTPLAQSAEQNKNISVMIVGFGLYGEAFLRNVLWMYQIYGYHLSIHVLDKNDRTYLEKRLRKQMPDIAACIINTNDNSLRYLNEQEGDCCFDIRVYPEIDCDTSDLADLFQDSENSFRQTQLVFVTLGNDDNNIETAVELRRLFDRMNEVSEKSVRNNENELPLIYSIVYDDRKASNLNCGDGIQGIKNHKKTPYHIHFIGKMSDQYNYASLLQMKDTENNALWYHFEWIKNAEILREYYHCEHITARQEALTAFKEAMVTYFKDKNQGVVKWGDEFLFENGKLNAQKILDSVNDYVSYEYYRESSIAKSIHKDIISKYFQTYFDTYDKQNFHFESKICPCQKCRNIKISEHMRWNAYMRTNGFIFSQTRRDRAKTHNDLIPWKKLPEPEKYKD